MKLLIRRKFDAAHFLPNYNGPCAKLHGHTWRVDVEVAGPVTNGMVMDFKDLKAMVDSVLPDHDFINGALGLAMPTAENLACHFYGALVRKVHDSGDNVKVVSVAVWESEDACAIYAP